ncbi:heterokaryon incompatibility protein-domain-containing protein [Immersiella caudata]|uniref:Heterokaryon incompatibility protein-domain-containing protein n=1 Tax=Immersiella caudata TaxID=314043 RepID=A0AA39WG22_9PEZI|nr:heterokaryon incompatibility protein-domain-containing protein [Immersiella caudata]
MSTLYPLPTLHPSNNHFRLVDLHPGPHEAPLLCTLSEFPLTDHPPYEALSYAWQGDHHASGNPIMTLNSQPFPVTRELESALRRLRKTDAPRTMWIDWVCINQADVLERGSQVAIMREIYRRAERVVAWIGEEGEGSDRAMDFLREMAMARKRDLRGLWVNGVRQGSDTSSECGDGGDERGGLSSTGTGGSESGEGEDEEGGEESEPGEASEDNIAEETQEAEENMKRWGHQVVGYPVLYYDFETSYDRFFDDSRQTDWDALDDLLARPWWSRTWVVQEVWHSQNAIIQCGGAMLKWKTFEKAMDYQEGWDDVGCLVKGTSRWAYWDALKRRYGLAIHISKRRLLGSKLSDLLWNMWDREATDPRDKVFAVLGLVGDENIETQLQPDYTKSMNQVYREAAASIILGEKSLDILLAASASGARDGLPSWVPDWRREANDHRPALFINGSRMRTLLYYSGSTSVVEFHGHGYSASGKAEPEAHFDETLSVLHARGLVFDTVAEVGPACGPGVRASEVLESARSVLDRHENKSLLETGTDALLETVLRAGSFVAAMTLRSGDTVIETTMNKRRFFVTTGSRLCIGPSDTRTGDSIAILAGCNFPIILRQLGESRRAVVGEAYVHNCMAGEVLGDASASPHRWEDLAIS